MAAEGEIDTARLWRESAVLLGAATGLLYLTSQIYGAAYLDFFGVEAGFQAFGLNNLALMGIQTCLRLGAFGLAAYFLIIHDRTWRVVLFAVGAAAVGSVRVFLALGDRAHPSGDDWWSLVASVVLGGLFVYFHFAIPRSMRKHKIEGSQRDIGRAFLVVLAGYATAAVAVPCAAVWAASEAAMQPGWISKDGLPARVPVYWVGDRVVYLTADQIPHWPKGVAETCRVHVQINGVEQGIRTCSAELSTLLDSMGP